VLGQAAHLLAPTHPPYALIDILYSRVSHAPDWGAQAEALTAIRKPPRLINKWPLPDLSDLALRRTLADHGAPVRAVAIAPDGTWLASGDEGGSVRIWDPATGEQRWIHRRAGPIRAVAIAPDGAWLASAGDGSVRIWDPATGGISTLMRVDGGLEDCARSPSSQSLAAAGRAGLYRFTFRP
jgi:WD40 repeat protein